MGENEKKAPRVIRRSAISQTPKLCPRCLSPLERGSRLGGWLIPQDYSCPKCGYGGHAYLEAQTSDKDREPSKGRKDTAG